MSRKNPRTREQVLAAVNEVVKLIEGGMGVGEAKKKTGISNSTWTSHRPLTIGGKPVEKRRTRDQVEAITRKAHALVMQGVPIGKAADRVHLGEQVYRH